MCTWCNGRGLIFAWKRNEYLTGEYVFKCECISGKTRLSRFPPWNEGLEKQFVMTSIDLTPLTKEWVIEQFQNKQTVSEEFKRRIEIWGRDRFVEIWNEYKESLPTTDTEAED